ncbi:hypothetical protein POF50_032610 [Streptomyces sp. SL13]|uniref:Chromosome partitioning protein n=1 Tax=Streptantibioticus silvisoli TaxID=2705255 RepID=A0AA90HAZ2_9ACTN|nr:hypothetical protein [Streptantibioticus silvisoli]MDI5974033.1 hypothetical protein [Streptantibioticus silvisoli]
MTRTLVAIGSAKGSPGTTTLALALAACWPSTGRQPRPLVVEADPSGGDVAARFGVPDSPGLVDLAAAARRSASPHVLRECMQILPGGVHVIAGPVGWQQAAGAVGVFAGNGARLLRAGMGSAGSVLLDVGRLQSETAALVGAADRLLLVTQGEAGALTHAAARAAGFRESGRTVELVVVGKSPYSPTEIGDVLGLRRVHRIPWDPRTAQTLKGRPALSRGRWRTSPFIRAVTALAAELASGETGDGAETTRDVNPMVGALPSAAPTTAPSGRGRQEAW